MNGELTLASRYAMAYIHLYDSQLDFAKVNDCEHAADFLMNNPAALLVLKLSTIPADEQRACLAAVCTQYRLPATLLRLVDLLIEHNRLSLFPKVLYQIKELYTKQHNIATYTFSSVDPLDEKARTVILGYLEKITGKRIVYTEKIDTSLIAGIRLQSDTTLWEYSIQKQLRELEHQFNV